MIPSEEETVLLENLYLSDDTTCYIGPISPVFKSLSEEYNPVKN